MSQLYSIVGFFEDFEKNTFGTQKKGVYRPLSNFVFSFTHKVIACNASSTGYLVNIELEEHDNDNDDEDNAVVIRLIN